MKKSQKQERVPPQISQNGQIVRNALENIDATYKRGFEAAKAGRIFGSWTGSTGHINDDILSAWRTIYARSNELYQNNPLVQNYFQLLETNVVGPDGFVFKARTTMRVGKELRPNARTNEVIEFHVKRWSARGVCELSGRHSLKSLLNLVVSTVARDGDAFIRRHEVKNKKNPYGIALQLISSKRVDVGHNVPRNAQGVAVVMGIEIDANDVVVAYHLNHQEAGIRNGSHMIKRERVPADEMYHVYSQEHAEQLRGISWLAPVMNELHQLQAFEECTAVAARVGASKMGFFQRKQEVGADDPDSLADGMTEDGEYYSQAEPGQFQVLPFGWEFVEFSPEFPAATHASHIDNKQKNIASGLRLGKTTLFMDVKDVNYSSIRQDKIAAQEMFKTLHSWLIEWFLEPVIEDFFRAGFLAKAFTDPATGLHLPDTDLEQLLNDYSWHGRSWQWVDPKNDLEAMKIAKDLGIYSPAKLAEMMGEDIFVQMADTAVVRDAAVRLDIFLDKVNDPEANAERKAVKEAAESQAAAQAAAAEQARADAKEAAAKASQEAEEAKVEETSQADAQEAERSARVESMTRELSDVKDMLRELLARAVAPVVETVPEVPDEPAQVDELTAAIDALAETVDAIAQELEAATAEEGADA